MNDLMQVLKALSDPTRTTILAHLSGEDLCVGALANRLGVTHSAVSQHLRILREAGLVSGSKRGYWVHYSLDRERVREVSSQVSGWLEQLASAPQRKCATDACVGPSRRVASVHGRGRKA
jgi:ArsR family transcriptional regulator, arsenate/arsenite/antimonite-responsive transcriptional repressor